MARVDSEKQALYSRLRSIESDLSGASGAISDAHSKLAYVEGAMGSLPSRLAGVRGRGYAAMGHLEKSIDLLTKRWVEVSPVVKQAFLAGVEPLTAQINGLQAEARRLRSQIDSGNIGLSHSLANRLAMDASSLRARAASEASKVSAPLSELTSSVNAIDRDLKVAEKTVELFALANFPLKQGESPVLAIEGRIMSGDKSEGTLYFTNQRFLFEGRREVVLEKKLFIVTKKKTERIVQIDQPIGALQEISKGRVGLLAWTGIYVRFKPERGMEETPFDVKGWEADVIGRFFSYVMGGEADRDIATVRGTVAVAAPTIHLARCSRCGAPYTREIYKGQTSVQCEYCGTQIVIQYHELT
jgi:DNA-directed RNA polymerase subunit RPC12/RpoP